MSSKFILYDHTNIYIYVCTYELWMLHIPSTNISIFKESTVSKRLSTTYRKRLICPYYQDEYGEFEKIGTETLSEREEG